MDNKRIKSILLRMKESIAIGVALLILMLCFGMMDTVVSVINNSLLHVTSIERDVWLDWLFIIITTLLGYGVWWSWIKTEKRIAPKTIALILVPTVLFVFFRLRRILHTSLHHIGMGLLVIWMA